MAGGGPDGPAASGYPTLKRKAPQPSRGAFQEIASSGVGRSECRWNGIKVETIKRS
jgi:hypothetical protein